MSSRIVPYLVKKHKAYTHLIHLLEEKVKLEQSLSVIDQEQARGRYLLSHVTVGNRIQSQRRELASKIREAELAIIYHT